VSSRVATSFSRSYIPYSSLLYFLLWHSAVLGYSSRGFPGDGERERGRRAVSQQSYAETATAEGGGGEASSSTKPHPAPGETSELSRQSSSNSSVFEQCGSQLGLLSHYISRSSLSLSLSRRVCDVVACETKGINYLLPYLLAQVSLMRPLAAISIVRKADACLARFAFFTVFGRMTCDQMKLLH